MGRKFMESGEVTDGVDIVEDILENYKPSNVELTGLVKEKIGDALTAYLDYTFGMKSQIIVSCDSFGNTILRITCDQREDGMSIDLSKVQELMFLTEVFGEGNLFLYRTHTRLFSCLMITRECYQGNFLTEEAKLH